MPFVQKCITNLVAPKLKPSSLDAFGEKRIDVWSSQEKRNSGSWVTSLYFPHSCSTVSNVDRANIAAYFPICQTWILSAGVKGISLHSVEFNFLAWRQTCLEAITYLPPTPTLPSSPLHHFMAISIAFLVGFLNQSI